MLEREEGGKKVTNPGATDSLKTAKRTTRMVFSPFRRIVGTVLRRYTNVFTMSEVF